ncbi:hypothetical protein tf_12 [Pseudomonas phage tf]|uniref:Uncharacterized protein n=1 Tax=Pseudomonas phage tf TaxID=1114179 RepID=J7RFX6_9CAUD|nr:hypothetical protein tf_12 [Pseudomonas phage tf]CCL97936.1 hypothetical protein tf_12 [Pseudomonas phage tf]
MLPEVKCYIFLATVTVGFAGRPLLQQEINHGFHLRYLSGSCHLPANHEWPARRCHRAGCRVNRQGH